MNDEFVMLSGLQHFAFCPRQWALIHLEQQWQENGRTMDGRLMHERAHDAHQVEKRGDVLVVRGLRVHSQRLYVTGICDVVEFHRDEDGASLAGYEGKWMPEPVEYKRGCPKAHDADALQLCAQAMCLEEMLLIPIAQGSLYYGETRRRQCVAFTDDLRARTAGMLEEMHQYLRRGYTPRPKPGKSCNACSLKDICLPELHRTSSVSAYIRQHIGEESD